MKRLRYAVCFVVALAVALACAWRIYDVNARAIRYPTERHRVGEDVSLEGCNFDGEDTDGYAMRLDAVQVMSYNDYVRAYGTEGAQTVEGLDVPSVLCLTVTISNNSDKGPEDASINVVGLAATKSDGSALMRVDTGLWAQAEPAIDAERALATGVLPHTSYTTHLPLTAGLLAEETLDDQAERGEGLEVYYQPVKDGTYDLHLSVMPKRKLVEFTV